MIPPSTTARLLLERHPAPLDRADALLAMAHRSLDVECVRHWTAVRELVRASR